MKLQLGIGVVFSSMCALLALSACEETGSSTSSNTSSGSSSSSGDTSSSSSSSSGSSGMTSSSSSSGSSGMTSSSSSSGMGGYSVCSDCTQTQNGAWVKECKMQTDKCNADADCKKLTDEYLLKCPTDASGGCCVYGLIKMFNTPAASQTLFFAMDNCVYCQTCKTLCDPGATEYCKVTAAMGANCPP